MTATADHRRGAWSEDFWRAYYAVSAREMAWWLDRLFVAPRGTKLPPMPPRPAPQADGDDGSTTRTGEKRATWDRESTPPSL